jgi:hypothetical protein
MCQTRCFNRDAAERSEVSLDLFQIPTFDGPMPAGFDTAATRTSNETVSLWLERHFKTVFALRR